MFEEVVMGNETTHHLKLINFIRVVIYLYAIVSQVFWAWVINPSGFTIDPMIVLVPLALAISDLTLVYWNNNDSRKFWNVLPLVTLIAILVAINAIWTNISAGRWYTPYTDLVVLSVIVIFASMYEMLLWIKRNQIIMKGWEELNSDELRTYNI